MRIGVVFFLLFCSFVPVFSVPQDCASYTETLARMRADASERHNILCHDGNLVDFEFSADGDWLVLNIVITYSSGFFQYLRVMDTQNFNTVFTLEGHMFGVTTDGIYYTVDHSVKWIAFDGTSQRLIGTNPLDFVSAKLSPDGEWVYLLVTDANHEELQRLHVETGEYQILLEGDGFYGLRWSPDGTWLMFERWFSDDAPELFVMQPDGANTRVLIEANFLAWSSDGVWVYFFEDVPGKKRTYRLGRVPLYGGQPDVLVDEFTPTFTVYSSSIVGHYLIIDSNYSFQLIDVVTGERIPIVADGLRGYIDGSFDGRWLHFTTWGGNEARYSIATGTLEELPRHQWTQVRWSPDGTWGILAEDSELYGISPDGTVIENLTQTPDIWEGTPVWTPDGEWVIFRTRVERYFDGEMDSP